MTKSLGAGAIKSLICFTSPESPPDTCFNSKTFNFFMTTSPKFNYKKVFEISSFEILRMDFIG